MCFAFLCKTSVSARKLCGQNLDVFSNAMVEVKFKFAELNTPGVGWTSVVQRASVLTDGYWPQAAAIRDMHQNDLCLDSSSNRELTTLTSATSHC